MAVEPINKCIQICTINNRQRERTIAKCEWCSIYVCACKRTGCHKEISNFLSFHSYPGFVLSGVRVTQSSLFWIMLCRWLFVFCVFSFDHCIVLLVLHFTASSYPFRYIQTFLSKQPIKLNTSTIPITIQSFKGKITKNRTNKNEQHSPEQYNMLLAVYSYIMDLKKSSYNLTDVRPLA